MRPSATINAAALGKMHFTVFTVLLLGFRELAGDRSEWRGGRLIAAGSSG
jgi:hypothetical protein